MRRYSRLESVEEKRNMKKAIGFVFLAVLGLVLLFYIGIPLVGKFAAFVSDLGNSGNTSVGNDTTPPAPPRFNPFSDSTNQSTLELTGSTEGGATVKLVLNGSETENIADKNGHFTFNITLADGENTFSAISIDNAKNTSQPTDSFKIIFDNKAPDLNIDSPQNGSQYFGTKQRQVSIQGTTESTAKVTVNDRIVTVDDNGKFTFTTTLSEGENKFLVKAADEAGNTTEKELVLHFSS
jgi:hypothetical protein